MRRSPAPDGATRAERARGATPRRLAARVLVALALGAAEAALGTWWAALLLARGTGTGRTLDGLGALVGGSVAGRPSGTGTAGTAVGSLGSVLGLGDPSRGALGSLLGAGSAGGSARLAHQLHGDAAVALVAAAGLALLAVGVAPGRRQAVLRLAGGVVAVAGLALLVTWPGAAAVSAWSHGGVHRAAGAVLRAGAPVRLVLGISLVAALVVAATAVVADSRLRRRRLRAGISTPAG